MKRKVFCEEIPRPKKPSTLPKVLSTKDVRKMLESTTNVKHRLVLKLAYGLGLRVSEISHLKLSHIDSKRKIVEIISAKGKKDRYLPLPDSLYADMVDYYREYKPKDYLLEGIAGGAYPIRTIQAVFKQAMNRAGIRKKVGIHGLRHSYATHLLEAGTDSFFIKDLLGHKDIKTTLIYTKVAQRELFKIQSPLDRLNSDS